MPELLFVNESQEKILLVDDEELVGARQNRILNVIEEYVRAVTPQPLQVGAILAVNGRIAGVELFDSPATFRRFLSKIVRSYAMDAIEECAAEAKPPAEEAVHRFLEEMKAAALERPPAASGGGGRGGGRRRVTLFQSTPKVILAPCRRSSRGLRIRLHAACRLRRGPPANFKPGGSS